MDFDNDYNYGTIWSRFIPVWQQGYNIGDEVTFLTSVYDDVAWESFVQTIEIDGASSLVAPALALISAVIMF